MGLVAEPRLAHAITAYFAQPDLFDPDRFLPERGGRMYEFIPFMKYMRVWGSKWQ